MNNGPSPATKELFLPKNIPILGPSNHHSLSDWDVRFNRLEYTTLRFISPPSSIHPNIDDVEQALCRIETTLNLPQGRIVTWFRVPVDKYPHIWFRHQSPLGEVEYDNFYYCSFPSEGRGNLGKYVNAVNTEFGYWYIDYPNQEWFQVRLTWWNGLNLAGDEALVVRLERQESGLWVTYGELYDPQNSFKDSEINRVGFLLRNENMYNDDFEIWRPT